MVRTPAGDELPIESETLRASLEEQYGAPIHLMRTSRGAQDAAGLSVVGLGTLRALGERIGLAGWGGILILAAGVLLLSLVVTTWSVAASIAGARQHNRRLINSGIYAAYGYGGNGITYSYLASRMIAASLAGDDKPWFDDFAIDRDVPKAS